MVRGRPALTSLRARSCRALTPAEPPLSTSSVPIGKSKREQQDFAFVLKELQAVDETQVEEGRHLQMLLEEAREARWHEAVVTWQHQEEAQLQSSLSRHTQPAGTGVGCATIHPVVLWTAQDNV